MKIYATQAMRSLWGFWEGTPVINANLGLKIEITYILTYQNSILDSDNITEVFPSRGGNS